MSVDSIAEHAGIAKVTLYRHFPTKAELVRAVLEMADGAYLDAYRAALEAAGPDPAERLAALFESLDTLAQGPDFRGCIFVNTGLALADSDHPGHEVVRHHKDELLVLLEAELRAAGHADPEKGAVQLLVLVDGALVSGALRPDQHPGRAAGALAQKVLE